MTSIRSQGDHGRLRQMEQLAARRERNSQRLASSKRIATAADDAAGLAIANRLAAGARSAAQGERNLADGQGLVRTAEASLQSSQDGLARMRELSVQARNGTLSSEDRQTIQQEFDQLAAQLDQTAAGTTFGGRSLLDGSASGGQAVVVTDGAGGDHTVDVPDLRSAALGVAGLAVDAPGTLAAIDGASARVGEVRAALGTADNTLERHGRQLGAAGEAFEAARSRLEDVDVAQAMAEQVRDRILLGLQVSGQRVAGSAPRRLLDLLG
jgi:flagellin